MTASTARTAALVAIPVAASVAWITAHFAAPGPPDPAATTPRDVVARLEKLERTLDADRQPSSRDDRGLAKRIEALESRKWIVGNAAATAHSAEPAAASTPSVAGADEAARQGIVVGLTTEPAGAEHRTAVGLVAQMLLRSVGPPLAEKEFAWSAALLGREAGRDRITAQEATDLSAMLAELPAGHVARPALAKAVAIGWSRDERLGSFLGQFPANAEPSLHQGILYTLNDEHPSAAFSEYVIRMVREERAAAVLAAALGLDRIEAAATVVAAPRLVETIETRLLDGTLDAKMRVHAGLALAVASLRIPEAGTAALRRVADRETDSKVAEKYRQAATSLQQGSATLKSLERLFE